MGLDDFSTKHLFLSAPLAAADGVTRIVTLDDMLSFIQLSDTGEIEIPENCNPFELIFSFEPGFAANVYDTTRDMMLPKGLFCGYGILPITDTQQTMTGRSVAKSIIPAGQYLFVQSFFTDANRMRAAAEALWLESLWDEIAVSSDTVYIRLIKESEGWIFQIIQQAIYGFPNSETAT